MAGSSGFGKTVRLKNTLHRMNPLAIARGCSIVQIVQKHVDPSMPRVSTAARGASGFLLLEFLRISRPDAALPEVTWLITFTCYGTHFHAPEQLGRWEERQMKEDAYRLDSYRRAIVLKAIKQVCSRRNWT